MNNRNRLVPAVLGLIIAAAALFRVWLFYSGRLLIDADQVVPGIGALRILREGKISTIVPGQHYMAEIYSWYFAPLHLLFGSSAALLRLGMIPLALLMVYAMFLAARAAFRSSSAGLVAAALVAFAPSMVTDWFMRPSSMYIVIITALLFSVPLVLGLVRELPGSGWTCRTATMAAGVGLLLGFAYWAHPGALIYMAVIGAFLLMQPPSVVASALALDVWKETPLPSMRAFRITLQLLFVMALMLMTVRLLLGGGTPNAPSLATQYRILLRDTGILTGATVLLFLAARSIPASRARCFGLASFFVPLWIGALPYIVYRWAVPGRVLGGGGPVNSWEIFSNQLASVFHTAIPILLGWFHAWAQPTITVPKPLSLAAQAIYWLSIICLAAVVLRARLVSRRVPPGSELLILLFVVHMLIFAATKSGYLAKEPRYLLALYIVFAAAVAFTWQAINRLGTFPARAGTTAAVLLLIVFNIWSCTDLKPEKIVSRTGELRKERNLLRKLDEKGIRHVSTRFSASGYWSAYKLTYIADERIVFAPARHPIDAYNRSERYQREVERTERPGYLVELHEVPLLNRYLAASGATSKSLASGKHHVVYDVQPDVLKNLASKSDLERLMLKKN